MINIRRGSLRIPDESTLDSNQPALRKYPTVSAETDSEPHQLRAYLKATKLMWFRGLSAVTDGYC
eukprot:1160932-Pelagomonas_calceolata.AAC.12